MDVVEAQKGAVLHREQSIGKQQHDEEHEDLEPWLS